MRRTRKMHFRPEQTIQWANQQMALQEKWLAKAREALREFDLSKFDLATAKARMASLDGELRGKGIFARFVGRAATERRDLQHQISCRPAYEENKRLQLVAEVDRCLSSIEGYKERIAEANGKILRQQQQACREARRREQREVDRAIIARVNNGTRAAARSVKVNASKDHDCPYCGGPLGRQPHLDHIYPVRLGGLSTKENTVHVCQECNLTKGSLTLNQFIAAAGLDRSALFARLSNLGKSY